MKLAASLVLLLAACTSLVPTTVARLSALNPLDADPADLEVALSLPPGIDIRPNGAALILSADRTGESTSQSYRLERADTLTVGSAIEAQPGGRIVLYRIAHADVPKVRAQQDLIRDWKAEDDATRGGLGVSLDPCVRGEAPAEDAEGAVWLRAERDGPFLPLVRPTPLDRLYDAATIAAFPPCE